MQFLTLDRASFEYGQPSEVTPGVRRVIAENPSKFTYHGTGTYIVGRGDVAVVDPGPDLDSHREALARALDGERVTAILVTHCHSDHSPLSAWLRAETGAPTIAYGPHVDGPARELGTLPEDFGRVERDELSETAADDPTTADPPTEEGHDREFTPDVVARTGDVVAHGDGWEVAAIHTPGHTPNHTCFAMRHRDGRVLFTGDHVMGWSTTVVSPPDGDMVDYIDSLRVVGARRDDVALPTHGPPIERPQGYIVDLINHRLEREDQVVAAVRRGLDTIPVIVTELYAATPTYLHRPAAASVLSHLVKLVADDQVIAPDGIRFDGRYVPA